MAEIPVEHPDTPKPVSKTALRARKDAIRSGALIAPARDTLERAIAAPVAEEPVAEEPPAVAGSALPPEEPAAGG